MADPSSGGSRGRSRSRETGGRPLMTFGRYEGVPCDDVLRNDPDYCDWATRIENPSGPLRQFAAWVRNARSQSEREQDSDTSSPDERFEFRSGGPVGFPRWASMSWTTGESGDDDAENPHQAAQKSGAANIISRLPHVTFSPKLFSGDPHPKACPICMENFASPEEAPRYHILRTQCLHVFHEHCLKRWLELRENQRCPICRYVLTDDGQNAARHPAQSQGIITVPDDD